MIGLSTEAEDGEWLRPATPDVEYPYKDPTWLIHNGRLWDSAILGQGPSSWQ